MDFFYSIKENVAKMMIALGLAFLTVGVLTLTMFLDFLPMLTLFLGFVFLMLGFFTQIGLFSVKLRSTSGLAMILLCISVVFFALAVASIPFQQVIGFSVAPVRFDGNGDLYPTGLIHTKWLALNTDRPLLSLFILGMQVGLVSFLASLTVVVYGYLRSELGNGKPY